MSDGATDADRKTDDVDGAEEAGGEEVLGEECEEEQRGSRSPARRADPREPSEQERNEHNMTHLPFRNWCRHCIRGRGKEEACRRTREEVNVPEIHLDFMFMGEESGGKAISMLVAKERRGARRR